MADYYSILGVSKTATNDEIKIAFRKLAKIYHPDKNPNDPNAKQLFQNILKAYNVLSNHHSRRRYDNGIVVDRPQHKAQRNGQKKQKEWTFTEEDLKRREYYKKHYHAKKQTVSAEIPKSKYSDYKNILFATPIAVGLLMLIVSIFNSDPKTVAQPLKTPVQTITEETSTAPVVEITNGDKPYTGFFGGIKTSLTDNSLKIYNSSNFDAVIVLFDEVTGKYLQHSYVQNSFTVEFTKLPNSGVYWKCMLGQNWNNNKPFLKNEVLGGFDSIVQYQNHSKEPVLFYKKSNSETIVLNTVQNSNKKTVSTEEDFFTR